MKIGAYRLKDYLIPIGFFTLILIIFFSYGRIFVDVLMAGIQSISFDYIFSEPKLSGRTGGVFPIIISTLIVLGIAILVALPISMACALFTSEFLPAESRLIRVFRSSMLILACVPSIAFGFFGFIFFAQTLGFGISLLTGGLTLATMIIPICTFALEDVFRLSPTGYRFAAYSLGASKSSFIFKVLIPSCFPEIISVMLLGIGRALAETAALLFTSGYSDRMPSSIFEPGRVLSLHIYDLAMNIPGGDQMAAASSILLLGIFLIISILGMLIARYSYRRGIY